MYIESLALQTAMLSLAAYSATAVASATAYAPAFFWAEKFEAGLGHRAEHLGEVSGKDLERTADAETGIDRVRPRCQAHT